MKITIHADPPYRNEDYTVELNRNMDEHRPGDLICYTCPFFGMPLLLEIAIHADGSIGFRSWNWDTSRGNAYLHTSETADKDSIFCFSPTEQQIDTVNGLFSGRIKWEGLKLSPGATLQAICPINVEREEQLIKKGFTLTSDNENFPSWVILVSLHEIFLSFIAFVCVSFYHYSNETRKGGFPL